VNMLGSPATRAALDRLRGRPGGDAGMPGPSAAERCETVPLRRAPSSVSGGDDWTGHPPPKGIPGSREGGTRERYLRARREPGS
jgi:hypothetical protein